MSQIKKNYTYVWVSFIVLVFGILVVPKIIDRIKNHDVVDNNRLNTTVTKNQEKLMNLGKAPQFSFTDENGEIVTQDFYNGKVYLVEFFFTKCPSICPIMNKNMRKLDDTFGHLENFGIASFSIDEVNDTPEVLNQHAKDLGVKSPNWHFFSGKQADIFALAKQYNLFAAANPDAPGGFEHSGLFALIDKFGNVRCRKDSIGNPIIYYDGTEDIGVSMLKEDIKILLEE